MSGPSQSVELVSSWFGYLATSFSIASYLPTIAVNWATKSNLTTPAFVYIWLIGDFFTIVATLLMQPRFVIVVYVFWCFTADLIMFIQLQLYGSTTPGARQVLKGNVILQKLSVLLKGEKMKKMHLRMAVWDNWDSIQTGIICFILGTGMWAVFTLMDAISGATVQPTNSSILILVSGTIGSGLYCLSTFPELHHGLFVLMPMYRKDRVRDGELGGVSTLTEEEKIIMSSPRISKDAIMFYYLMISNYFSVAGILLYSTDLTYVTPLLPSVIGPLFANTVDITLLILAEYSWWPAWRKTYTYLESQKTQERYDAALKKYQDEVKVLELQISGNGLEAYEQWYHLKMDLLRQDRVRYDHHGNIKNRRKDQAKIDEINMNIEKETKIFRELMEKWKTDSTLKHGYIHYVNEKKHMH